MTFGQLFTIMNPNVRVHKNGTCIWLYLDDVNHYTIGAEWWDKEIPNNAIAVLKEQEPVEPIEMIDDFYPIGDPLRTTGWKCGRCGERIACYDKYYPNCGKAVEWE